jgi:hypothetical protein
MVRFGFRVASIRKRLSARTSLKRYVRNSLGLKAPRGWGWLTNPRKAAYNRICSRTMRGCLVALLILLAVSVGVVVAGPLLMGKAGASSPAITVTDCSRQQGFPERGSDGEKKCPEACFCKACGKE